MTSKEKIDYGNVQSTRVIFEGEETTVTLAHGREMRASLETFLKENQIQYDELRLDLLSRLKKADVWIDGENGTMRIGHWLLQNKGDALILMNRLRTPKPVAAYVAEVVRDPENKKWIIKNVTVMRIFGR